VRRDRFFIRERIDLVKVGEIGVLSLKATPAKITFIILVILEGLESAGIRSVALLPLLLHPCLTRWSDRFICLFLLQLSHHAMVTPFI
jgi:hypothetical protein